MCKINFETIGIDELFGTQRASRTKNGVSKPAYDVSVSPQKNGSVRFGLLNAAADLARMNGFIEVADQQDALESRIYFRFHEEPPKDRSSHKLSFSNTRGRNDSASPGRCFNLTPKGDKAKRLYRTIWSGRYMLQYDARLGIYYIDNTKKLAKED